MRSYNVIYTHLKQFQDEKFRYIHLTGLYYLHSQQMIPITFNVIMSKMKVPVTYSVKYLFLCRRPL